MTRADWHGRFSVLLVLILFTILLSSLASGTWGGRVVARVLLSGVLLGGVWAASRRRRPLAVAVGLAISAMAATWLHHFRPDDLWVAAASHALVVMVFGVTLVAILSHVVRQRRVTVETISGGICVYLLIGFTGAFLYSLVELFHPGSLRILAVEQFPPSESHRYVYPHPGFDLLLYYSFITLATVGYGDIIPLTTAARSLSALEAILGQLFLAVFIARLVGMHIASADRDKDAP